MEYSFYGWETEDVKPVSAEFSSIKNQRHLYDLLSEIWSSKTCAPWLREKWNAENKTLGQCSITSFLAQDIFGGKVYGILREDGNFHCYNKIGSVTFDLTSEQFKNEVMDYSPKIEQFREIHFQKEEKYLRYKMLKSSLLEKLHSK